MVPAKTVENDNQPVPEPLGARTIERTFEDPDAPTWIIELSDRIAAGYASPEEMEAYRRWCRGEEVEAPAVEETSAVG